MRGEKRHVEFVYTPSFEASAKKLLTEEDRRSLELLLLDNPERGALVERTGGFRKVRFGRPSRREGRSGGTRVVYFFAEGRSRIFLLLIYSKGTKDSLTRAEENELRRIGRTLEGDS
jgi:mRNA-degrading endonuclease RelE of RelBE toxin-antitoxin system